MSLPRYRRPRLSPVGKSAQRKWPTRQAAYAQVAKRAKGRCEDCGRAEEQTLTGRLDPHHAFRRGHLAGIPAEVCDFPECIFAFCRPCHDTVEASGELTDQYRWLALERFAVRFHLNWNELAEDPLDEMRRLCRIWEKENVA